MDKLYIQLSKTGDVVNLLPLLHADAQSGLKVGMMACDEFASVLDGCSHVEKVAFDGKPWELDRAVVHAKTLCDTVIVTQTNGPREIIAKYAYEPAGQKNAVTCAHNREQFKLAGRLKEWGKHPLIFDRRNPDREKLHMPKGWFGAGKKKRIMLVALDSVSSPFPYRDLLFELLSLKYPNFNIVDLSLIKAERFYDLLGLYEAAHCLVTVDTAHLHLAAAVPTLPVMALVQDKPLYWNGSAWRSQHHFYCRYHDFPKRALELFNAIENIGSKPISKIVHVFHGDVRKNDFVRYFPIQPGSCFRDSVNVLNDKERHPMLPNVVSMMLKNCSPENAIILSRKDTKINDGFELVTPSYAYRMNRDKEGNDTFFPAVDMFCASFEFWQKIQPEIPDVVFGPDAFWSRILLELFKINGAREVEGIFRYE